MRAAGLRDSRWPGGRARRWRQRSALNAAKLEIQEFQIELSVVNNELAVFDEGRKRFGDVGEHRLVAQKLSCNVRNALRFQRYVAGTTYIGLGLVTAFAGGDKK